MIFNQNKKLSKALDEALARKRNGENIADIIKLYPEFSDELKSLLSTAKIVEKSKEDIQPSEAVLQRILTRLGEVTNKAGARYSSIEKGNDFLIKMLSNFNQAIMSKKAYVGAMAAVFLLAVIVGVGWYNFSQTPLQNSFEALEEGVDEFGAEMDYLIALSNDPFADLEGDLQKISEIKAEVTASTLDAKTEKLESEIETFDNDLKELESLGAGTSLDGIDATLSTIDEVLEK